jgi:hypothetical protein
MNIKLANNTLKLPVDWWIAFLRQAQAKEISLSEWVGECCRVQLPRNERRKLSRLPNNNST